MAYRVIDDKLKTKLVFAMECGAAIRSLEREFGISHHTLRRWRNEAGKEPEPVKRGYFDRETFWKDVVDLLEDEGVCRTDYWRRRLADSITELAAASLVKKLPYTIGKKEGA